MDGKAPRTRIQEKNTAAILEAALEVFSQAGFRGATLDQIAKTAGLSKPNLLYYFPSKEAIHVTLLSGMLDLWLDPLRAIDGGADGSALAVDCVRTAGRVLAPGGALVLQVGTEAQLDGPVAAAGREHGLVEVERRVFERGVLALLRHADGQVSG